MDNNSKENKTMVASTVHNEISLEKGLMGVREKARWAVATAIAIVQKYLQTLNFTSPRREGASERER